MAKHDLSKLAFSKIKERQVITSVAHGGSVCQNTADDFLVLPFSSQFNGKALSREFSSLASNCTHWSGIGCKKPLLAWTNWSNHVAARIQKYCSNGGPVDSPFSVGGVRGWKEGRKNTSPKRLNA
eukprot:5368181-Karenia_brevis.AAC.1